MSGLDGGDHDRMLNALREQGGDRFDPVRFHFLQTLARRAQGQPEPVRRVLDEKLAQALAQYRQRMEQAPDDSVRGEDMQRPSPLAELFEQIGPAGDELKALHLFRDSWAKLSVDQALSHALATGPENAGPLNSHALLLQALQLLRASAPDYLDRFMAYADALLWLDQANSSIAPPKRSTARGKGNRKRKAD